MFDVQPQSTDRHAARTLDVLRTVLMPDQPREFAIRLWDGTIWPQDAGQTRRFTLVFNHPAALRRMILPPSELRIVSAYMDGDFDIEGDMLAALDLAHDVLENWRWQALLPLLPDMLRLPANNQHTATGRPQLNGPQHSITRDRQAIQHHYDVSNDFYRLWLDDQMVYSCAYFTSPDDDIDSAQQRKLDYICRKLRLQPGQRLLDIGCGWGALVRHAARYYGVYATGVTISENQFAYACERIVSDGLTDRCCVEMRDYRDISELHPYDAIVSVGMVEHVGRENLPGYFEKIYRLLRPGGVFLNHGITLPEAYFAPDKPINGSFLTAYIFPDGDLQPVAYRLTAAAQAGFEIRDVENLREHYALTLKHWWQRYEANKQRIIEMRGRAGYRLWKLYLVAARWLFETGMHGIHQSLLYKLNEPRHTELPLTRADWYTAEPTPRLITR